MSTAHLKYTSPALTQWIQDLEAKFGVDEISYRETGANGWSTLDVDKDGKPSLTPHNSGPHWIDASPRRHDHPWKNYLFGTFKCTSDTGVIYE